MVKNGLLRLIAAFRSLFPQRGEASRALVISTTGLGDTLWGTPALKELRKRFSYLCVLTSPTGRAALEGNPDIDALFVLRSPAFLSFLSQIPRLRSLRFGKVFLFHTSQRSILPLATLLGARELIGTEGLFKGLDSLLTERVPPAKEHEIARRLRLVGALEADPQMYLAASSSSSKKKIIGLNPGSKDRFKQWPASHFIELGKKLQGEYEIVVTGGSQEKELVKEISDAIPGSKAVAGAHSVRELGALIQEMALFISNDTGPMHVSLAVGTLTLGLFTPTDRALCGPYQTPHGFAIQKKTTCTPCLKKRCRDPFCMRQISVEEVYREARRILSL